MGAASSPHSQTSNNTSTGGSASSGGGASNSGPIDVAIKKVLQDKRFKVSVSSFFQLYEKWNQNDHLRNKPGTAEKQKYFKASRILVLKKILISHCRKKLNWGPFGLFLAVILTKKTKLLCFSHQKHKQDENVSSWPLLKANKAGTSLVGAIYKAQKYSRNNSWKHWEKIIFLKVFLEIFFCLK